MARTIKHVSEMSRPPRKKPPAYTYRLPLRMVESADGDIYPSGVDTLETKAHLERRDTEEAILETKRFCTVTLARESDMNSTFRVYKRKRSGKDPVVRNEKTRRGNALRATKIRRFKETLHRCNRRTSGRDVSP